MVKAKGGGLGGGGYPLLHLDRGLSSNVFSSMDYYSDLIYPIRRPIALNRTQ